VAFWRLLALVAVGLSVVGLRGCERYTQEYNTLPMLDFVESLPPLSESEQVQPASELALGLGPFVPTLSLRQDAEAYIPQIAPPGRSQRTASGVRDAARVGFGTVPTASTRDLEQTAVSLSVIVFYSPLRAAAWDELMTREMDIRDPVTGSLQMRSGGPEAADRVWVTVPREAQSGTGEATVIGTRGPVMFQLQARLRRSDATGQEQLLELAARAEVLARQTAEAYADWLATGMTG
jgi:hypothetical protein